MLITLVLLSLIPFVVLPGMFGGDDEDTDPDTSGGDSGGDTGGDSGGDTGGVGPDILNPVDPDAVDEDNGGLPGPNDGLPPIGDITELEGDDMVEDSFEVTTGSGNTVIDGFEEGLDDLTLTLADGGMGTFSMEAANDGSWSSLHYTTEDGEDTSVTFNGLGDLPYGDIFLSVPNTGGGETILPLTDIMGAPTGPVDEDLNEGDTPNGPQGPLPTNNDPIFPAGPTGGDDSYIDEPLLSDIRPGLPTTSDIIPPVTTGPDSMGPISSGPVTSGPDDILPPGTPDSPGFDTGAGDEARIFENGETVTGTDEADTFWLYYDTTSDVGYAEMNEFQPGQDVLRITMHPAEVDGDVNVDIIPFANGSGTYVEVNGERVAALHGVTNLQSSDIFIEANPAIIWDQAA